MVPAGSQSTQDLKSNGIRHMATNWTRLKIPLDVINNSTLCRGGRCVFNIYNLNIFSWWATVLVWTKKSKFTYPRFESDTVIRFDYSKILTWLQEWNMLDNCQIMRKALKGHWDFLKTKVYRYIHELFYPFPRIWNMFCSHGLVFDPLIYTMHSDITICINRGNDLEENELCTSSSNQIREMQSDGTSCVNRENGSIFLNTNPRKRIAQLIISYLLFGFFFFKSTCSFSGFRTYNSM